jgi:hypothetical protein
MSRRLAQVITSVDDLPEEAPWERLPGESTSAYQWFNRYREMDSTVRSISRLAKEHGRSPGGYIRTQSQTYFWLARVAKWDEHLVQLGMNAQIAAVEQAHSIRAQVALKIFEGMYDRMYGKEPVVDDETGELLEQGVTALDPGRFDAKDLAALGALAGKFLVTSAEHIGLKPLDEQRVNVTLAFDLDGPRGHAVVDGHATVAKTEPTLELPRGEPETA